METFQNPSNAVYIYGCTFKKNVTKTQYLITVSWGIQPKYERVCIDSKVVFIIAHPGKKETTLHTIILIVYASANHVACASRHCIKCITSERVQNCIVKCKHLFFFPLDI